MQPLQDTSIQDGVKFIWSHRCSILICHPFDCCNRGYVVLGLSNSSLLHIFGSKTEIFLFGSHNTQIANRPCRRLPAWGGGGSWYLGASQKIPAACLQGCPYRSCSKTNVDMISIGKPFTARRVWRTDAKGSLHYSRGIYILFLSSRSNFVSLSRSIRILPLAGSPADCLIEKRSLLCNKWSNMPETFHTGSQYYNLPTPAYIYVSLFSFKGYSFN